MNNLKTIIGVETNAATLKDNQIKMVASACGVLLKNGAVIAPGAFSAKVLRQSVIDGWVDIAHEWEGEPIGYFDKVYMDGDNLMIEATFHTHEEAQTQRQIIQERLDAGKSVAVSIGYQIAYNKVQYFESGQALLDYCKDAGYDLNRFDQKTLKKCGYCWLIPEVTELNEVSICNVGMNPAAKVLEVNDFSEERMTLSDALKSALAAVERAKEVLDMRTAEGRTLSKERLDQLTAIHAAAGEIITNANAPTKEQEANRLKFLMLKAKSLGV